MKKIILIIILIISKTTFAQKEITTTNGMIHFEASVPLFEEVEATNETVSCVLNIKTGAITSIVLMKDFHFKLSLMEEHFNNKYLETDKYQKASFKGRIQGFNLFIIGTKPKEFKMNGKLQIHGKSKTVNTIVFLKKVENGLELNSNLDIKTSDYNIKIPEILSMKVAENVTITTQLLLK
jgi:polyisoprenoid-binding protein YceI